MPSARVAADDRQCAHVNVPMPLSCTATLDSSARATEESKPAPRRRNQIRLNIRPFRSALSGDPSLYPGARAAKGRARRSFPSIAERSSDGVTAISEGMSAVFRHIGFCRAAAHCLHPCLHTYFLALSCLANRSQVPSDYVVLWGCPGCTGALLEMSVGQRCGWILLRSGRW